MRKTVETVANLKPESCEAYAVIKGKRYFVAACKAEIDVKRYTTEINMLGSLTAKCKNIFASVVFCMDLERSKDFDPDIMGQAEKYEIICEFQTGLDESEKVTLDRFVSVEADFFNDEWIFGIEDKDTIKKILRFA